MAVTTWNKSSWFERISENRSPRFKRDRQRSTQNFIITFNITNLPGISNGCHNVKEVDSAQTVSMRFEPDREYLVISITIWF